MEGVFVGQRVTKEEVIGGSTRGKKLAWKGVLVDEIRTRRRERRFKPTLRTGYGVVVRDDAQRAYLVLMRRRKCF
jgi:hypothetical protein